MRKFEDLSEREILALAISNEEEDARIFADFADGLHDDYPASAKVFDEMATEENGHRRRLINLFASKFGEHIPLVRRQDIRGYIPAKPVWHIRPLGLDTARSHAREMERAAARFYRQALTRASDASTRKLLGDLAEEEERHDQIAAGLEGDNPHDLRPRRRSRERAPAICAADHPAWPCRPDGWFGVDARACVRGGLRDPQFVERVARRVCGRRSGPAFRWASPRLCRTMASFRGGGAPLLRGLVCGLMTMAGGIGHTLPFLIPYFYTATVIALVVVIIELSAIAWIQWRYMEAPPLTAAAKVMIGGALVLAAGILIGSS